MRAGQPAYWERNRLVLRSLRPDVTFHDGSTLTAADVAYSMNRFLSLGEGDASTFASHIKFVRDHHKAI